MADSPKIDRRPTTDAAEIRGYEASALPTRPVLLIAAGLTLILGALLFGTWLFARSVSPKSSQENVVRSRNGISSTTPPLQPQQGHEKLDAWDLQTMRDHENATFEKLGWSPRSDGTGVSVPHAVVEELRRRQQALATTQTGGAR